MNKVTQAHVEAYREFGTVHVPGVFDRAFVSRLTGLLDQAIERLRDGSLSRRGAPDPVFRDIEFEDHDGYVRLVNLMPRLPELRAAILESPAAQIVAALTGASSLRFWLDATFSKVGLAAETATPWHNDECTFSLQGAQLPSLWIALTDVDDDNSPLQTLVGSHRDTWRYHSPFLPQDLPRPDDYRPWDELLARVRAPVAAIRSWSVAAGDILLIHPRTIHGAPPRRSDAVGRRLAFTLRWIGSDVRWQPNPLTFGLAPFDRHPAMTLGAPPPEDLFPVVWRR